MEAPENSSFDSRFFLYLSFPFPFYLNLLKNTFAGRTLIAPYLALDCTQLYLVYFILSMTEVFFGSNNESIVKNKSLKWKLIQNEEIKK